MDPARISSLLQPFLQGPLSPEQLRDISMYIDILVRWNARVSLTAVRRPEEIVTRHFGESLFAAGHLFPGGPASADGQPRRAGAEHQAVKEPPLNDRSGRTNYHSSAHVLDVGSGAGFPGLPIKLWGSNLDLTLIESNQKKATFLREVIRALALTHVDVFSARAESFPQRAAVVTMRAVERFESALATAASLVVPGGRLALLIGRAQYEIVHRVLPTFTWGDSLPIPDSERRILLIGRSADHPV